MRRGQSITKTTAGDFATTARGVTKMTDFDRRVDVWNKKSAIVHAVPEETKNDDERTLPFEPRGSQCQRCEGWTDDIFCVHGYYWVCPGCANFHRLVAERADMLEQRRAELGMTEAKS